MAYSLYRDLIQLTEEFEEEFSGEAVTVQNFAKWLSKKQSEDIDENDAGLMWEGKEKGRTVESLINTSLVRLFRYAKLYSKIVVADSPFTTIDELIFLINLLHTGSMTKIELISLNILEKSTGIQIINRLLAAGFIVEEANSRDKRSKKISITEAGKSALNENMNKVRAASKLVVGSLNSNEKLQLAALLQKLEHFHAEKIKEKISFEL